MFDAFTTALILASPPLEGLNIEDLPKRLTQAFADVVAARIRFRKNPDASLSEELLETLQEMRRIAAANEALVALLPEREDRSAAAFVAAAAHQAFALGANFRREKPLESYVDDASVSPEVCATLLFLVAEAQADASECAKQILPRENASPIERALLFGIAQLARGQLRPLSQVDLPEIDPEKPNADQALQALQLELLKGLRNLAAQLQRRMDLAPEAGGVEEARSFFRRVKDYSVEQMVGIEGQPVFSLFPGPLHLANLLLAVERDLIASAIVRVPPPTGVEEDGWWQIIRRMSGQRPYLWKNHRDAISKGYLEQGISSAISFPTGGGKSTLAELKIATALLRGEQVIFFAPTNALVDQTATALKRTFKDFDVIGEIDDEITFDDVIELPEVVVTTPERCLMLLSIQPESFANLGLIVFDECHLLHPRDSDRSRRAVDAMLALLNLAIIAPTADILLLSAMMKNTAEMAGWITELTGRPCLPLDISWKPTRQVRGAVVYAASRIKEIGDILTEARKAFPDKKGGAPVKVERELTAIPYGLFCLLQNWTSTQREDYALLHLIDDAPHFSTSRTKSGWWRITPNGNKLSAAIAASAAESGLKTLVFVGSEVLAYSAFKEFRELLPDRITQLNDEEQKLYALAAEEMGGPEYCYLAVDENGTFQGGSACHHALLLREERHLHESLFRRRDGVDVLFATSTLAQGMNLPSEVVLISGDSRFDPEADKMATLEAHELLNAAGRAGRAGESSQGFVLVIPSRVIQFDDDTGQIDAHWETLQKIFEQGDQCLVIDDPFANIMDLVHDGAVNHGMPAYLLSKLPLSSGDDPDETARKMLSGSFAAFRARQSGQAAWVDSRVGAVIAARKKIEIPAERTWVEHVSSSTGVSAEVLLELSDLIDEGGLQGTSEEVALALLHWLSQNPARVLDLMRPESIEGLFGDEYKNLQTDKERGELALLRLRAYIPPWLSGAPLCEIEQQVEAPAKPGLCKKARHFALRVVPELAFLCGLPDQILRARSQSNAEDEDAPKIPIVLSTLRAVVKEGCDSPESLATRMLLGRSYSRVHARKQHAEYVPHLDAGDLFEDFESTRERVRSAIAKFEFSQIDWDEE